MAVRLGWAVCIQIKTTMIHTRTQQLGWVEEEIRSISEDGGVCKGNSLTLILCFGFNQFYSGKSSLISSFGTPRVHLCLMICHFLLLW